MVETKFKRTEIALIPEDWEVINLGNNCLLKARIGWQGLTTSEYLDTGEYFLVTGTDFKNGFIDWNNCVFVDKLRYDQDRNIQLKENDVLITKDGTIGKIAYINKLPKQTTLNSGVFVLRPNNKQLNNQFIYYVLMSFYFNNFLTQITAGSTITHLYQKDFVHFNFISPPLSEQQAIAKALSDTDAWIESLEKLIAKKCLLKQGTMQQLFTPKEGWERKKIGEICIITRGASPRPIDSPIWFDDKSNIGWVRISDVTKSNKFLNSTTQSLSEVGVKNSRYVKSESLIMSICATIGKPIITKIDVCIHDGFVVFTDLQIDQNYLYNFLKNIEKEWAKNGQTGSQMNLNTTLINTTEIIFPKSRLEQTHIASILSDMDSEIQTLEQKLNKARQIKQGMMQELLTGRIRLINSVTIDNVKVAPKGHNEHFNDAVLIGTMSSCFGSAKFPMTRFKYTKVSYLLKRYKEEQDAGYLKKAAGPYKPQTRYGGAEKIALKNKYVETQEINYKGKTSEGFIASDSVNEALKYFNDWYGIDALEWIKQFKFETNDNLELWATVDMAIEDLKREGKSINVESIKQVIKDNKEWRDKLKRPIFSDINIQKAITKLYTLFT